MQNNNRYQNTEYYNNPECYKNKIQKHEIQEQVQPIVPITLDYDQNEWIDQFSQNTSKSLINVPKINHDPEWQQSKYYDYIQKIQYFFSQTNNENQLILTQEWIPIIPQSNDSTVEETILNTNTFVKVQLVDEFLSDFDKHLNELQDNNSQQQRKITEMQEQAIKYQKEMKEYTEKENELQTEYNKLSEEYTYLESNYLKYIQKIEKDELLKDNSKIPRGSTKYTLQLMKVYIQNKIKKQNQNLSESISQKKQQIQENIENLQGIQNEKFKLKEQLTQLQKQQQQFQENQEQFSHNHQFQSQIQGGRILNGKQQSQQLQQQQQQKQQQSQLDQEQCMYLLFEIDTQKYLIIKEKSTKYNDFVQKIQVDFFPNLNKKNQFTQISTFIPYIKQNLKEFQQQLVTFLDELQENTRKQQGELSEVQEQQTKWQESTKTLKEKIKEKEIEYNKLKQNLQLLESIYNLILEITKNRQFIKDDCDLIKQMNQNTLNLVNEKDELENLSQKLSQEQSQLNQQFEEQCQKIENQSNETFSLKKQIEELQDQQQYQIQAKDFQNFKKMKTTGIKIKKSDTDDVDSKQPSPQKVGQNLQQKKTAIIKIQQVDYKFDLQQELSKKQTVTCQANQSQDQVSSSNQNLTKQVSECSYCHLSCSEYILLPCSHQYHKDCLEMLGKKAVEAEKPVVKCICGKKISIKFFTKNIQHWLLAHQVDQIFQQYKISYQLRQCNDCDFYYINRDYSKKQSYCPNCQI